MLWVSCQDDKYQDDVDDEVYHEDDDESNQNICFRAALSQSISLSYS